MVAERARRMSKAYEEYAQARVLKQPLAGVYVSFFVMVTFGAPEIERHWGVVQWSLSAAMARPVAEKPAAAMAATATLFMENRCM